MGANKNTKDKYIIIGLGAYINDIADIIHANNGVISKIYQNMPEVKRDRVPPMKEKIDQIGYPIDVFDSLENFQPEAGCKYALGCITPLKYKLVKEVKAKYDITFSPLIHPQAYLGSNVHIGEGVLVSPGETIGPNVVLDDFCVLNRSVMIGHDTKIGKYARLTPSVSIAGFVNIGEGVSIGIGATLIDRVHIGDWSIIGAGSLVTKDIPEKVIAYGSPAKVVRENKDL